MQDVHGWWGRGGLGILFWILVVLAIAALVKKSFVVNVFSWRSKLERRNTMTRYKSIGLAIGASSLVFAALLSAPSHAQVSAPGFVSKPMLVSPISGDGVKEIAFIDVSMAPGASSPRHTHPGDCYGAVIEGIVELRVEGQEPRRFSAGQVWHNPRGPIHEFKNVGDTPARLVNTLVVDKGKPRTQIQPAPQK